MRTDYWGPYCTLPRDSYVHEIYPSSYAYVEDEHGELREATPDELQAFNEEVRDYLTGSLKLTHSLPSG